MSADEIELFQLSDDKAINLKRLANANVPASFGVLGGLAMEMLFHEG